MRTNQETTAVRKPRRARPRPEVPGADTRRRLLDCAEQLFAERGFSGVSVREIVAKAEVNIAAANYHFGTKEELFTQVFLRCSEPVSRFWLDLLHEPEAAEQPDYLERLLRGALLPSFTTCALDFASLRHFNRLRAHVFNESSEFAKRLMVEAFGQSARHLTDLFERALPHLGPADLAWRVHIFLGSMIFTSMPGARLYTITDPESYHPEVGEEAVEFLVPLLSAMFRSPPLAPVERPML